MAVKIAPSILSADFSRLDREIRRVEEAGADLLHVDVMDGHFVPNITIGAPVVKSLRKAAKIPLDVHLMIDNPGFFLDDFIRAGSDIITVHAETVSEKEFASMSGTARSAGRRLGVSLNPSAPLDMIKAYLPYTDFVLVMSVNPGFAGQEFIPGAIDKVAELRGIFRGEISVDGGINDKVAGRVIRAGADILAAGSYIFGASDVKAAIERIRNAK
ncbi:MAG: ribulose-phosphate 3-epimerase [Candidatus Omnitrophota bacterium]|jgi:ribulose-phosphate 3-epimerase|nr:ribulose-phosphate 3-epimerase [Candidatus Omnitrophota bacterium]